MRQNIWRLNTYTPYFDNKLSWMPNALVYIDSYAIYTNSAVASAHPEWILKDQNGNSLYIPWGCSNGSCPQYAADIANPQFQAYMIGQIKSYLAGGNTTAYGYHGLFLDDVNLVMQVGNRYGTLVTPMDSQRRQPMTDANWRSYFAGYVEAIRAAIPHPVEIMHNSMWSAGGTLGANDPSVTRQIAAADYINIERGFGDSGLTAGNGSWSVNALMNFVDRVHQIGAGVNIDDYYLANQVYSLAGYFLVQNGNDSFGINEQTPQNWPSMYSLDLGAAKGARYNWNGMLRRDFVNGIVLMNLPGSSTQAVTLPSVMYDENGQSVSTVSLSAKQGGIYTYTR